MLTAHSAAPTDVLVAGATNVLVTGATGMQGGAAARALLRAGHAVSVLVRDPNSRRSRALADQGAGLVRGDLDDLASLEVACTDQHVVFSIQLPPREDDPEAEGRQARDLMTAAYRSGVRQAIHTSVSGTGWRQHHTTPVPWLWSGYWDAKEAAEAAVRDSGLGYWTIIKPAFYMESFVAPKVEVYFPHLAEGKLLTAASPETLLAMVAADDLGAVVSAAVQDPVRFSHAEIDLAGDALTYAGIADILAQTSHRPIEAIHLSVEELERDYGVNPGLSASQVWLDYVGYPGRPHHAARYGLGTTTFARWAARQDWTPATD